jgi:hypothetical protein
MAWADVVAAINFWTPGVSPPVVNGVTVASAYRGAQVFAGADQGNILAALQNLYNNSPTAQALLDAGVAAGQIWLFNVTGVTDQNGNLVRSYSFPGTFTAGIDLSKRSPDCAKRNPGTNARRECRSRVLQCSTRVQSERRRAGAGAAVGRSPAKSVGCVRVRPASSRAGKRTPQWLFES